jgi:hypothetical protein
MPPNEYRLGTANPVMMFELMVSSWCNYRCTYCVATVHKSRDESQHAFDHHPVDRWVAAFARVPHDFALVCRGGEPLLDHENFAPFLAQVGGLSRLQYMRVDTNGSWDPARYASVPEKVRNFTELNVSFHPTQIDRDRFENRLARILDAGWKVGMINYVLESEQAGDYEKVRDHFRATYGVYVNPNPDAFDESWASRDPDVLERARRKLVPLLPLQDLLFKTGAPTRGKSCWFPSVSYMITPNGMAARSCGAVAPNERRGLDFIRDSARVKPLESAMSCPQALCLCLDRYAFLEELDARGRELNLLSEYVRDCRAHQDREARTLGGTAKRAWSRVAALLEGAPKKSTRRLPIVR